MTAATGRSSLAAHNRPGAHQKGQNRAVRKEKNGGEQDALNQGQTGHQLLCPAQTAPAQIVTLLELCFGLTHKLSEKAQRDGMYTQAVVPVAGVVGQQLLSIVDPTRQHAV